MPAETQAIPGTGHHRSAPAAKRGYGIFVPMLLMALTLVGWLAFLLEQRQLGQAQGNLALQTQQAAKVRTSLDAVATATAKLAGNGNANAKVVVDELRKRGVTINPEAATKAQ